MTFTRLPAIARFTLSSRATLATFAAAAVQLADPSSARAANNTCAAYAACERSATTERQQTCASLRREDVKAPCPPLTAAQLAAACASACTPSVSGTLRPKFLVLSVIYAPPGSAGKGGGSSVDYGTAATTGVNVSTSSSFKSDLSTQASASLGTPLTGSLQLDASVSSSDSTGSSVSLDLKKKSSSDIRVSGPATDGIDHNKDEIWVMLSPIVNVTTTGNAVTWSIGADSATLPQFARVEWLKNPSSMPADVARAFTAAGFTDADYKTLLARDPFAYYPGRGPGAAQNVPALPPDPARYLLRDYLTYEPDDLQTSQVYTLSNDSTTTSTTTAQDQVSLGLSITASGGFTDWLKVSLKDSASWTWTNGSTHADSTDWSESASATVVNPSLSYSGATDIAVYWDTIYRTFLFMPVGVGAPPTLGGSVMASNGQPIAGADVTVTTGTARVHAFTDRKGAYRVYDLPAGGAQVAVGATSQAVTLGRGVARADFRVNRSLGNAVPGLGSAVLGH